MHHYAVLSETSSMCSLCRVVWN